MTQIAMPPEPTKVEESALVGQAHGPNPRPFPRQGEWTYEDWLGFPNDGWKYEIINGVLHMSPPPLIDHQDILLELVTRMRLHAQRRRLGKVLCAPCGVRLPGQPVPVEPDILFVRRERLAILGKRYVEGAPDLIVEILSPSNATYDLETKYALYEQAGVAEYWLVNPWEQWVRIYTLTDGGYQLASEAGLDGTAASAILDDFSIAINSLFSLEIEES
jgi:Uma2 family endonuclease